MHGFSVNYITSVATATKIILGVDPGKNMRRQSADIVENIEIKNPLSLYPSPLIYDKIRPWPFMLGG